MFTQRFGRSARDLIRPAILIAGLLSVLLFGSAAYADNDPHGGSGCRTDPLVLLSDGHLVRLAATIDADPSEVQQVIYTLHAPVGLTVVQVIFTGESGGPNEVFNFAADQAPRHYISDTYVQGRAHAAVESTMQVFFQGRYGSDADSSETNSHIPMSVLASR